MSAIKKKYNVRKLKLGRSEQLDKLALASGALYSLVVTWFWRTVRRQGIWLKPASMMRWLNSYDLHAHSADAVVQCFYANMSSWRARRLIDPSAHPVKRRRKYFKIQWKKSAMRIRNGMLILSNGRGNESLCIPWSWQLPELVEVGFDGNQYELRATYLYESDVKPLSNKIAAADLGEVHSVVIYDGESVYIANGRLSRSKKQYRNKVNAELASKQATKKKGSRKHKRIQVSRRKQSRKLDNQIKDILHKQTSKIISTLYKQGVQTLVIGDLRTVRRNAHYSKKSNQKIHQMHHGTVRHMLSYKAERLGIDIVLQNEAYTSQTCPACGNRYKPKKRNYKCRKCRFEYHRDGVGAINILNKYRGISHVVGVMASPFGMRYHPHLQCSL